MTQTREMFLTELTRFILDRAAVKAAPHIPGRLRTDLDPQLLAFDRARLYLDPYYAWHVHEGRPAQNRGTGEKPFVWFRDTQKDPRLLNGRTPNRWNDYPLREITGDEFRNALRDNEIIVTRNVGPNTPQPFFSNDPGGGMAGFLDGIRSEVKEKARQQILADLGGDLNLDLTTTVSF